MRGQCDLSPVMLAAAALLLVSSPARAVTANAYEIAGIALRWEIDVIGIGLLRPTQLGVLVLQNADAYSVPPSGVEMPIGVRSMSLGDTVDPVAGQIRVVLNPRMRCSGLVSGSYDGTDDAAGNPNVAFPADSFLDLFLRLELPDFGLCYSNFAEHPLHLVASIGAYPPVGALAPFPYELPTGETVALQQVPCSADFPGPSDPSPGSPDAFIAMARLTMAGPAQETVSDADCDGRPDPRDNCPFVHNPSQADQGGLDTATPDGRGDACQCGDVNDNGIVQINDATIIKRAILGLGPGLTAPLKCNVTGPTAPDDGDLDGMPDDCRINDATVVKRAILSLPPFISDVCVGQPEAP